VHHLLEIDLQSLLSLEKDLELRQRFQKGLVHCETIADRAAAHAGETRFDRAHRSRARARPKPVHSPAIKPE
jgi:hypothetical protein